MTWPKIRLYSNSPQRTCALVCLTPTATHLPFNKTWQIYQQGVCGKVQLVQVMNNLEKVFSEGIPS